MPVFDAVIVIIILAALGLVGFKVFEILHRRVQHYYFQAQGHENMIDYKTYKSLMCSVCNKRVVVKSAIFTDKKWFHPECLDAAIKRIDKETR